MIAEKIEQNFFEEGYYEKRVWVSSTRLTSALIMFSKPFIGEDDAMGHKAVEDFLVTLSESELAPKYIAFWNNAVKLCVEDSSILPVINKLEKYGVTVLVAGQALDKLNLKSLLRVGKLANHFDLIDAINQVQKVVNF